jgi:hypothetical protein
VVRQRRVPQPKLRCAIRCQTNLQSCSLSIFCSWADIPGGRRPLRAGSDELGRVVRISDSLPCSLRFADGLSSTSFRIQAPVSPCTRRSNNVPVKSLISNCTQTAIFVESRCKTETNASSTPSIQISVASRAISSLFPKPKRRFQILIQRDGYQIQLIGRAGQWQTGR